MRAEKGACGAPMTTASLQIHLQLPILPGPYSHGLVIGCLQSCRYAPAEVHGGPSSL